MVQSYVAKSAHSDEIRRRTISMAKKHRTKRDSDEASFIVVSRENTRRYESKNESKRLARRRKHRGIGIAASIVAVLVCCAFGWIMSVQAKLNDSTIITTSLKQSLKVVEEPSDPFYMLLLGTDGRPGETSYRSDTIILARIDPSNKAVTLVSIPRDTMVTIDGYGTQKINAAHAYGGAAGVVNAVNELCGVEISHYAEVSFDGLVSVVDTLGGVEVDVPDRINDHKAGDVIIETGLQTLNGKEALAFCRSRKFVDGDYSRMRHQRIFIQALAKTVLEKTNPTNITQLIDSISGMVATDMSIDQIASLANEMRGMDTSEMYSCNVPSTTATVDGVSYVVADEQKLAEMMERVDAGLDPDGPDTMETGDEYNTNSSGEY